MLQPRVITRKIQVLDPGVVEQIAAGEVIERPLNIMKELLENSLDAGAAKIETDVAEGGIAGLFVGDNGCGMEEKEAVLALQRHTTSKISQLEDLETVQTFGFRGEALSSIAAVSRLELLTRREEDLDGTKIMAEGGKIQKISSAGAPCGTRVTVRDLFYNVPARRKFLKRPQTEESACLDLVGKLSLTHLPVGFQMKRNGKIITTLAPGESLLDRYLSLYPQTPENQLLTLEKQTDSLRVTGILGAPLVPKATRNSLLFFVNNRLVRMGSFIQAVLDGYSGYLQAGKYPIAVLFLEIDGKFVDINVHPAKAEVRFSHAKEIYAFLQKAVSSRLQEGHETIRPHVIPYYQPQASLKFPEEIPTRKYEDLTLFESLAPYEIQEKPVKLLGSIARTYAILQEGDTLFLMDLHNAHERINYDLLELRWKGKERSAQALLSPVLLQLSENQKALVKKHQEFLLQMGIELEEFGGEAFLLRSIPAGLERLGEKQHLVSLLDRLAAVEDLKDPISIQERVIAHMSCRSSIQAGDEIPAMEMLSLFERLLRSSNPYFCPFGRQILIKLTLDEIHKLFRRK